LRDHHVEAGEQLGARHRERELPGEQAGLFSVLIPPPEKFPEQVDVEV